MSFHQHPEDPTIIVLECDHADSGKADDCSEHWAGMQNHTIEQVRDDAMTVGGWLVAIDGGTVDLSPACLARENSDAQTTTE